MRTHAVKSTKIEEEERGRRGEAKGTPKGSALWKPAREMIPLDPAQRG
jgi:hypothetical protein